MRVALLDPPTHPIEWFTPSPHGVCSLCGSGVCQNNFSSALRKLWRESRGESRIHRMARLKTMPIKYEMRSYSPFTS